VERVRAINHKALVSEVCGPEERDAVTDLAQFYVLWTRKESVLKAAGVGLSLPMVEVRVTPANEPPRLLRYAGKAPMPAQMSDASPGDGYVGAVTVFGTGSIDFRERDAQNLLDAI
jgi:4'-phosphopantetheinyl transferase